MSYAQRHAVAVTANTGGIGTGYTPVVTGAVSQIRYVADATAPYENTADFTITVEATGEAVWSASDVAANTTVAPRQSTHNTAGTEALYAASGVPVLAPILVAHDRIKIEIAEAGNTTTGTFHVVIG
jgi:hypothetical protein